MTINYSAEKADMLCQGWDIDKNGVHTKFDLPKGWIDNIRTDVTKNLLVRSTKH